MIFLRSSSSSSFALRGRSSRAKARAMRLASTALLLTTFALTACSGTVKGTGTSADGGTKSGFDDPGACASNCSTSVVTNAPPSEYDALFTAPASPTVNTSSLDGVWAGTMQVSGDDVRLVITPSTVTIAVRCNSGRANGTMTTIGTTVNAMTSTDTIRTLEGKSVAADASCKISVHPQTYSRCSTGGGGTCFDLGDSGLYFGPFELFTGDPYGPSPSFSKMSDDTVR